MIWLILTTALAATPPELLAAAEANNPTVQAAQARTDALRAATSGAAAWPDPMVGVEVSNLPITSFAFDHPMAGVQLKASQRVPLSGAPGAGLAVAEARVEVGEAGRAEASLAVRRQVEVAWARLSELVWLEAVTTQHQRRTAELLDSVRARYEVGKATQGAVLRLQVLRDSLDDDLDGLRAGQAGLRAALSEATGTEVPQVLETGEPEGPPPELSSWLEAVEGEATPSLERLAAQERVAEAEARAARAAGRPDPTLSAGLRVRPAGTADPNPEWVSVGVSVPIPAGSARRARGQADAALGRGAAAEHQAAAERDRLQSELAATHAAWDRAWRQVERHRDQLIPVAESARETTLSEYRAGSATVTDLYEAEVQLLRLERGLVSAVAATWMGAAQARALLATDANDLEPGADP